jgi:phenylacetate-CoA ligase
MKLDMSTYEPFGLEAIETASPDEIAAVQTERLKRTLHTVYENVPAYRRKFDAAGVTPSDFRRLEDLEKFPFTTKQDLRDNYPFGMFAVAAERVARVHAFAVGYGLFTGGLGMHYGAERLGCMVVPVATGMTERQVAPGVSIRILVASPIFCGALPSPGRGQNINA